MFKLSDLPSLTGRTFLVTGGNSGIGYATCLQLAAHGAHIYMGARSAVKAAEAIANIKGIHPSADIQHLSMDHTSLATIVTAAQTFLSKEKKLHGLILNAGIMAVPYEVTKDGFESQMQVNYIAHWLLTQKLLPTLLATSKKDGPGSARVVCVSSEGHQKFSFGVTGILYNETEIEGFGPFGRYGLSKLANVLHAKTLNSQYGPLAKSKDGEIWTASLHPGFIDSQMNQKNKENASWKLSWIHPVLRLVGMMRPADEGCVASLFVGASEEFSAELSGRYFNEKAMEKKPNVAAEDLDEQRRLEKWTADKMKEGGWI